MSADLFAAFGASDEDPTRKEIDENWTASVRPLLILPKKVTRSRSNEILQQASFDGNDILFDAATDEPDMEDEFGDFEDVDDSGIPASGANSAPHQKPSAAMVTEPAQHETGLLSLDDDMSLPASGPILEAQTTAKKSEISADETDEWGDFEDIRSEAQPQVAPATPVPAKPPANSPVPSEASKNIDWELFEDWSIERVLSPTNQSSQSRDTQNTGAPQQTNVLPHTRADPEWSNGESDTDDYRPSNVPPPTILLQLLPQIFQTLRETAIIATQDPQADPIPIAAAVILAFNVSARIIAGRSLRWKRDQILAQSTRIGPSGRSGGMKLIAIDKQESIKEERDAAEVSDSWSKHIHIFSAAVSRADIQKPWMQLNTKTTPRPSPGFGTITAVNACALCGVKRDERIAGVDFDADDIFGEYWTEHWGHTDCKVFWAGYNHLLDHR